MTIYETHDVDIHDMVNELTRTTTHRERYTAESNGTTWTKHHITSAPALISQLIGITGTTTGSGESAGSFESKPAARIEALDTLALIDNEASLWLRIMGIDDPGDTLDKQGNTIIGSGTIACIRALHVAHAGLKHDDNRRATIETDVRRWWRQARVMSGWDSASWRPDNTCPACEVRRALRINLSAHSAVCVECRATWGPGEIGVLADHIRFENTDQVETSTPDDTAAAS